MIIVTDRAADIAPDQLKELDIHFASLRITLDDHTYESGVDLDGDTFYKILSATDSFPITSQPSAGEFAALYRELAKKGEEILSIHISSGLSGTFNAASAGAQMVPEAKVTLMGQYDPLLSVGLAGGIGCAHGKSRCQCGRHPQTPVRAAR